MAALYKLAIFEPDLEHESRWVANGWVTPRAHTLKTARHELTRCARTLKITRRTFRSCHVRLSSTRIRRGR